jgi:hypothetical protein
METRGEMSVREEILAVLKLAFTFRVDRARLVGRDGTIALLGGAAIAIWALLGWLRHDDPVDFDPASLTVITACVALVLGLAWLVSRASSPALRPRHSLWLVSGYLPAASAALWLLNAPISRAVALAITAVLVLHASLYFFFGLRSLSTGSPWRGLAAGATGIAAIAALLQVVPVTNGLWTPRRSADEIARHQESQRRAEALLYAQADRIDAALSAMASRDVSGPNAFFLGFAGFGEQQVFAQEIALAAQRMEEHFGTAGRGILLVNDRRDFDRHPLASRSALERALRGIGARMDVERDVLFLSLSSHGKGDPYLVVTNGALPLETLTPAALADMLKHSGIRWKVLVISACYSGAFIDALRDEYTVVITAAAPDRASFGCNDRRELTYFGEAFYRDALPKARSLRAAFDMAAADIAVRERIEGLKPSKPQAHFGALIERKLAELQGR